MDFESVLHRPVNHALFAVLDVETTGLVAKRDRVIEVAVALMKDGVVEDRFESFVNPGRKIPGEITKLTGIADEDLEHAPYFEEIASEIVRYLDDAVFVAHNAPFDLKFLRAEFARAGVEPPPQPRLCTLRLAKRFFPEIRSKSLSALCRHFEIERAASHRAGEDVSATARILRAMLVEGVANRGFETVEDVVKFQYDPLPVNAERAPKKLQKDFALLPDSPGVYYFLDANDRVMYVGKAKNLRRRVLSYAAPSADRRSRKILRHAKRLRTETANSELAALLAEAELVKRLEPKLNVQLRGYPSKYFIKFAADDPFPKPELATRFEFNGDDYYGAFVNRRKAEQTLDIIEKSFLLRECEEAQFKRGKPCLLSQIERCLGACEGADHAAYHEEVARAREFLEGKRQEALNRLVRRMKRYAEKTQFEKAAETKDVVDLVLQQTHRSSLLAEPINRARVLFEIDGGASERDILLLVDGKIFLKNYLLDESDRLETALDDYFGKARRLDHVPDDEDLEKLKIALNWIVKNRNRVRVFYLKDFETKADLFARVASGGKAPRKTETRSFELAELVKNA